jgi:hypothetical protein
LYHMVHNAARAHSIFSETAVPIPVPERPAGPGAFHER